MPAYVNPFQANHVKDFIPLKQRSCTHMTKDALYNIASFPEWALRLPEWGSEMCVMWLEMGKCDRTGCRLAHGQGELSEMAIKYYGSRFKNSMCRTIIKTKYCVWGEKCLFKHDNRQMHQIHRHHFTPRMFLLESLHRGNTSLVPDYEPSTKRLSVFSSVHA